MVVSTLCGWFSSSASACHLKAYSLKMIHIGVVSLIKQLFSLEHNDLIALMTPTLTQLFVKTSLQKKIYGSILHVLKHQLSVLFYEECFFFYRKAKINGT